MEINKNGLDPLVATVILLLVTMAIGGIVWNLLYESQEEEKGEIEPFRIEEPQYRYFAVKVGNGIWAVNENEASFANQCRSFCLDNNFIYKVSIFEIERGRKCETDVEWEQKEGKGIIDFSSGLDFEFGEDGKIVGRYFIEEAYRNWEPPWSVVDHGDLVELKFPDKCYCQQKLRINGLEVVNDIEGFDFVEVWEWNTQKSG